MKPTCIYRLAGLHFLITDLYKIFKVSYIVSYMKLLMDYF